MLGDYPHLPAWLDGAVDDIDIRSGFDLGPGSPMRYAMRMLEIRTDLHSLARRVDLSLGDLHKPVTLGALNAKIGETSADGIMREDISAEPAIDAALAAIEVLRAGGSRQEAALRCLYAQISSDLRSNAGELARIALHTLTHYGSTALTRTLLTMIPAHRAAQILIDNWKQAPCAT